MSQFSVNVAHAEQPVVPDTGIGQIETTGVFNTVLIFPILIFVITLLTLLYKKLKQRAHKKFTIYNFSSRLVFIVPFIFFSLQIHCNQQRLFLGNHPNVHSHARP